MVLPCLDKRSGIRIDFIFSFSPYEAAALKKAREIKIDTRSVKIAAPEDLIIHKLIAGRPRDLEDVRSVIIHQGDKLDWVYTEICLSR